MINTSNSLFFVAKKGTNRFMRLPGSLYEKIGILDKLYFCVNLIIVIVSMTYSIFV